MIILPRFVQKTAVGALSLLLLPVALLAHLSSTGLGPFYDGLYPFLAVTGRIHSGPGAGLSGRAPRTAGRTLCIVCSARSVVDGRTGRIGCCRRPIHSTPVVCFSFLMLGCAGGCGREIAAGLRCRMASAFGSGVRISTAWECHWQPGNFGTSGQRFVAVCSGRPGGRPSRFATGAVDENSRSSSRKLDRRSRTPPYRSGHFILNNHDPRAQSSAIEQQQFIRFQPIEQSP